MIPPNPTRWRVGSKVKLNVYFDDRPICQCHSEADAMMISCGMNFDLASIARQRKECTMVGWAEMERRIQQAIELERIACVKIVTKHSICQQINFVHDCMAEIIDEIKSRGDNE